MLKRAKRKTIKIREAMEILDECRSSVHNRIAKKELTAVRGEGTTSPHRVYESEVVRLAEKLGRI
jgi:hypothetical protein